MKRRRQYNSSLPAPTAPLARSRIAPRNAARKQREFARAYGSRERVRWVKSLPCVACHAVGPIFGALSAGTSHNAHTVTGGTGRKADYDTIVPLCASHHRRYDEHQQPFDTEEVRAYVKALAAHVERLWQSRLAHLGGDA